MFSGMADEEVVVYARQENGAMEYLLQKYSSFVRMKARNYFLIGADRDDLVQEGMIGLYKAVRDFKPDKLSSFRAFADLCVTRQLITAIKTATRQKHHLLNTSVPMEKTISDEDGSRTLLDTLAARDAIDPQAEYEKKTMSEMLREEIFKELSDLEKTVISFYLLGKSYSETATELRRGIKSVDNALQRAKRKIGKAVEDMQREMVM